MKQLTAEMKATAKTWAAEHARHYQDGFMACANGEDYTNFQAEPWKMGYRSAITIFSNLVEQRAFAAKHGAYVINPVKG